MKNIVLNKIAFFIYATNQRDHFARTCMYNQCFQTIILIFLICLCIKKFTYTIPCDVRSQCLEKQSAIMAILQLTKGH